MEIGRPAIHTWLIAVYPLPVHLQGCFQRQTGGGPRYPPELRIALGLPHQGDDAKGLLPFAGPAEIDGTYAGVKECTEHWNLRARSDWHVGRTTVIGVKDRTTNAVDTSATAEDLTFSDADRACEANVNVPVETYTAASTIYTYVPNRSRFNQGLNAHQMVT